MPAHELDAKAIAELMAAAENRPMLDNNSRPADDADRSMLAERVVESWHRLRTVGAAA
jgi:hypothetical protein